MAGVDALTSPDTLWFPPLNTAGNELLTLPRQSPELDLHRGTGFMKYTSPFLYYRTNPCSMPSRLAVVQIFYYLKSILRNMTQMSGPSFGTAHNDIIDDSTAASMQAKLLISEANKALNDGRQSKMEQTEAQLLWS